MRTFAGRLRTTACRVRSPVRRRSVRPAVQQKKKRALSRPVAVHLWRKRSPDRKTIFSPFYTNILSTRQGKCSNRAPVHTMGPTTRGTSPFLLNALDKRCENPALSDSLGTTEESCEVHQRSPRGQSRRLKHPPPSTSVSESTSRKPSRERSPARERWLSFEAQPWPSSRRAIPESSGLSQVRIERAGTTG